MSVLSEHVDPANTHLHTDSNAAYKRIADKFEQHSVR